MKIRSGFVSNSSSSSFMITNKTNETKSLVDFAKETLYLLEEYEEIYHPICSPEEFLKSAEEENFVFKPNETKECIFGDESGTLVGSVYDYMLRDTAETLSFSWYLYKMLR